MRPRTSSLRRDVSDDQLSLCSMDSSLSQGSSSMNTEGGHSALGDLMETSSHGSSFEEQPTDSSTTTMSTSGSTSGYAGQCNHIVLLSYISFTVYPVPSRIVYIARLILKQLPNVATITKDKTRAFQILL